MTQPAPAATAATVDRCAFCGYRLPVEPVRGESGTPFCTERCRAASADGEEPFADRMGYKRYHTGVSGLDALLPLDLPASSFVLLAGQEGIRHRGLQTELVWRALERGEPAVIVSFVDPPTAVVEHFFEFGWNVLPHLESGDLRVIDCFTYRLRAEHRTPDHQVTWNEHLEGFLDGQVTAVEDTANLRAVESALHDALDDLEMVGTGVVVVDSLNEIDVQGFELEAEQFVKEVRGDVCARRFVPIFASTTVTGNAPFALERAYLFDGIVDMRRNEALVPGVRLRQLSVRKMDGVRYRPHWVAYEQRGPQGFQTYDPATDLDAVYGYRPGAGAPAVPSPGAIRQSAVGGPPGGSAGDERAPTASGRASGAAEQSGQSGSERPGARPGSPGP